MRERKSVHIRRTLDRTYFVHHVSTVHQVILYFTSRIPDSRQARKRPRHYWLNVVVVIVHVGLRRLVILLHWSLSLFINFGEEYDHSARYRFTAHVAAVSLDRRFFLYSFPLLRRFFIPQSPIVKRRQQYWACARALFGVGSCGVTRNKAV